MIARALVITLFATALLLSAAYEIEENFHLKPRTPAPPFKAKAVLNDKFINIALDDYVSAKKWTVLLFYPFDYTFVCPVSCTQGNSTHVLTIGNLTVIPGITTSTD